MYRISPGINKIDEEQLEQLIRSSPTSNVFQTKSMFQFWEKTDNHEPFAYSATDQDGKLLIVVSGVIVKEPNAIKSEFTKRAIIYGGPLINSNSISEEALLAVIKLIDADLKKKAIYIETRNLVDLANYKSTFKQAGWTYKPHFNFHVDCSDADLMKKRVSKSKMRQIRKSLSSGAEIVVADNADDVKAFYDILETLYKTKVKTPLPSFGFFKTFLESDLGVFLLIKYQNKIVGGIMCPVLKGQTIYELYICGLDGEIKDVYPSILATWAAMEYATNNGIARFDFMGAGPPDKDYGVREFKSKFGGEQVEYGRFIKIYKPLLYKIGATGVKILKSIK